MALDEGGTFRCELRHVSQFLDAEVARAESMHRPACMPVGSDGGKNGLFREGSSRRNHPRRHHRQRCRLGGSSAEATAREDRPVKEYGSLPVPNGD